MARDPSYNPLFEPIKIGPVTAPNRFYQVPHCSGMGYARPNMLAEMRATKAEGGWGVVCTEYCSIHASSDDTPYPHATLRDATDVQNLRQMTEAVHRHGSLAGVELWYGGHSATNSNSREIALDVGSFANDATLGVPGQSQAMSKRDIVDFREMYRQAALRALEAGFDIVYVYSNHEYMLHNFLSKDFNQRNDEYGGSIENRSRLLREVIEDVAEVITGKAALAVRYSIPRDVAVDPNELIEGFKLVAEMPDLWDITVSDYRYEMGSSRFVKEASNQHAVEKIRSLTSKPIVSVGRFTSPDTMLAQINRGTQDFIGAARPSIADPFLPQKIDQGRLDDIRECIGCNVCYAHDSLAVPIRCTQNPTMGEEWTRGWHPERIETRHSDDSVLVVGAGPAGLEAACALGARGYRVTLAEGNKEAGGRINQEAALPGLAELARVRDWRLGQLKKSTNIDFYPDNYLDADTVLDFNCDHIILATGSEWRCDGVGRKRKQPFSGFQLDNVFSVKQVLSGDIPGAATVIYDDDHYYLGSALALLLRSKNIPVTLVTPASMMAGWTQHTGEHSLLMETVLAAGVEVVTSQVVVANSSDGITTACVFSQRERVIKAKYLLPVTSRIPADSLWQQLDGRREEFIAAGGKSLQRIGDCRAPGIIAAAVYAGHKAARELGSKDNSFKRDRVVVNR